MHGSVNTLAIARWLYPKRPRNSLEHVASRLDVAAGVTHRALSDAYLVKDIFL
jgi:DNA polymerase III epsilon subunit-like protein